MCECNEWVLTYLPGKLASFGKPVFPSCLPSRPLRKLASLAVSVMVYRHFACPRSWCPSLSWPSWLQPTGQGRGGAGGSTDRRVL